MKRASALFLSILLCIGFILPFFHTSDVFAAASAPVIRVGVYPFAGFQDPDGKGGYTGYCIDYLEEIAKHTGWEYQYVEYDNWDSCYSGILNNEVDLIGGTVLADYRTKNVSFSQFPMASSYLCLYVLDSNQEYAYNDYSHFSGLRIGLMLGEPRNNRLQEQLTNKGVVAYRKYYSTQEEAIEALHNGEVDAFLGDRLYYVQNEHSIADFGLVNLYFMFNKNHPWLEKKFNAAMEDVLIENPNYNTMLFNKYYASQNTPSPVFTVEEKAFIEEHSTIKVWYDENWAPVSYQSGTEAAGIAPDLLRAIGEQCGITFEFQPMGQRTVKELSLKASPNDIICSLTNSPDLLEDTDLSVTKSYLDLPILLVGKQGNSYAVDQEGSVALLRGSINMQYYVAERWPNLTPETFSSVDECFAAVTSGRCNFTIQPSYVVNDYLQRQTSQVLSTVSTSYNFYPLCIGLMPDATPELRSLLNKGILSLSESECGNIILENTVSSPYKISFLTILQKNAWLISLIILIVLGTSVGYIAWSRKKISHIAYRDPLTNSYSYAGFARDANDILSHRSTGEWALVTMDIDGFKLINNTLGREEGDKLLIGLTHALQKALRKNELLCRSSADNFILLLRFTTVEELRSRMHDFDENLILHQTSGIPFKHQILTCGVCTTDTGDRDLYTMVGNANLARKSAKSAHHSNAVFYNKEMHIKILQDREIESSLLPALRNHEFVVYLQPKYALSNKKIVGAEALVRWQHPSKGLLLPGKFIPLAERNGFVTEIDFYVYREVFQSMRRWIDAGHAPVRVSMNVSRAHLQNPNFCAQLCALADEYDIPRQYIECELTESIFCDNLAPLIQFIQALKDAGFWVSIDDFGSGYSSLNMLKEIPVDVLKLDREFFYHSDSTERGRIVIASVIRMAKSLNMEVISEGVETEEQATLLNNLECDMAQGFLFSKPLPLTLFAESLLSQETGSPVTISEEDVQNYLSKQ